MQFNFHYTKYCHSLLISVIKIKIKNLTIFFASLFSALKKRTCQLKQTEKFYACITKHMQFEKC